MRFNQKSLEALKPDGKTHSIVDPKTPGLWLRVTAKGAKTYYLVYRMGGRGSKVKWLKLARFDDLPLARVREVARACRVQVVAGVDPAISRRGGDRVVVTVGDAAKRFMDEHVSMKLKRASIVSYRYILECHILPRLGKIPIKNLDRGTVSKWHAAGSDTPAAMNRALMILSSICTQAEIWGMRPEGVNPCRHIQRFPSTPRARDMQTHEIEAIGGAIVALEGSVNPLAIAAIKITALTAGRISEVLSLRWDADLHLDEGYALIREHKTERKSGAKRLELPPAAIEILRRLPRLDENAWVFPGIKANKPMTYVNINKVWRRICAKAGVSDMHLHDFRSFAASEALEQGVDARVTAKILGHATSRTTEKHYLRVRQHKTTEAVGLIASKVTKALGLDRKENEDGKDRG